MLTNRFHQHPLPHWFSSHTLQLLDQEFLNYVKNCNSTLHIDLEKYRHENDALSPIQKSEIIIATAKLLEDFLAQFFEIEKEVNKAQLNTLSNQPVFAFKKWYVQRRAKRRLLREENLPSFTELDQWLEQQIETDATSKQDRELAIAKFAIGFLNDEEKHALVIEKITDWCIQAIKTNEGRAATKDWISFKLPEKTDYQRLIPIIPVPHDSLDRSEINPEKFRARDGFELTDPRMKEREALSEVDYCVYCHDHDGDFCSKGFPEKKGDPSQGLRTNPLGNILTGCPLDEKISEMNTLKKDGYTIGALATVMIDNPMCPATGHRICNDCMKACIYQKQDPVDIPQIETRVLIDALSLPWGVEIYDLLTRWNPLRAKQWIAQPYNGLKVFIAGMGPAGFTMAHHLLMEGFAVVGTDGLKIETLPKEYLTQPIRNFDSIKESLEDRTMAGFGGVAEYGITVRWDKNFLKLIYISLSRRPHFQIFGGVRFGGTVTVEDLWQLGFHHAVIAVGAGLPKALPTPGSMARGMRQANDFLMSLQLTGAARKESIANLQLRLPAVVIGGGLTGVDAATEAQAYYIAQVEKTLYRYEILCKEQSEESIRQQFDEESLIILDEWLAHAQEVRQERNRAQLAGTEPNFIPLLRKWGGVTIIYRRNMEESPAYVSNHEELEKALEEGLYYRGGLQPAEAILDEFGYVKSLICQQRVQDAEGNWYISDETVNVPARSILVATGAQPNIAYTFEHHQTFKRNGLEYQTYNNIDDHLEVAPIVQNLKQPNFGPFTSYDNDNKRVSFIGDTHPVFQGNVVSAIASALRTYPQIVALFGEATKQQTSNEEYKLFADLMRHQFDSYIQNINEFAHGVELTVHAPMAAKKYKPGQFFRVQNYERDAIKTHDTMLLTEPMALSGFDANPEDGTIKIMILNQGASSQVCRTFKSGQRIAFMGPTGVRSKIPEDQQTILIIGEMLSLAYIRAVGHALHANNNKVIYIGLFDNADELYCQKEIESCTDQMLIAFSKEGEKPILTRENDKIIHGGIVEALLHIAQSNPADLRLNQIDRMTVIGSANLLKQFQALRNGILQKDFKPSVKVFGSIYSNMQCMLKGVCAQCLQWQINPETGQRTKAVFTCSWQDQPLEIVDLENLGERLGQNRTSEILTKLWVSNILK